MPRPLRIACSASLILLCLSAWGARADRYGSESPYGIPEALQASLDKRLSEFIEAQADRQWNKVADLLGPYRMGGVRLAYTSQHKDCFLSQVRSAAMVSFTPESIRYSSELYESPVDRWWWYLDGHARIRTSAGRTEKMSTIVAYRDNSEWYFTPPNIDTEWEKNHVTERDRTADYSGDITVDLDPGCPVDVRGLSVSMNPKSPSLRIATFSLANRTARAIESYTLGLGVPGEPCFGITAGIPSLIQPGDTSSGEKPLEYPAYGYWCEERPHHRLVIDSVSFVDGTEWKDPRFLSEEHQRQCDE